MQKIDLHKVESLFKTFQGKPVKIYIIGTITIPFYINSFDWVSYKDEITFGEFEEYDSWFYVPLNEELKEILNEYDNFTHEEKVRFIIEFDIFTTYIDIVFDCEIE